jgi:LmbE family N-acetylglucosaminyl deacetylase
MKPTLSTRWVLSAALLLPLAQLHADQPAQQPITFTADDRVLVLVPHPDDEVLGAGGVIQRALASKAQVKIVFLTYGDYNVWSFTVFKKRPVFLPSGLRAMGQVRRGEAIKADKILGVSSDDLIFLGYPDHGTMNIWCYNWDNARPFRSRLTKARGVPYKNAYNANAPYTGDSIVTDIKHILSQYRPTQIFVTNSLDENVDHRALYLFTRVAIWELETTFTPVVHPFLIHYRFRHWPIPQGLLPDKPLRPPAALLRDIHWTEFPLTPEEVTHKYLALRQHATQFKYSGKYLSSFVRTNELFGDYPPVQVMGQEKIKLEKKDETKSASDLPVEYTPEEKDAYVNLQKREVRVEDGRLVISTSYKRPFKEKFQFDLYAFGYRADRLFAVMPKIRVIVRKNKTAVFDGRIKLAGSGVIVMNEPDLLTIKIPLVLLGDPSRVLTGIHTSLDETRLDVMAWRALYLQ